ncbi:MAG: GYD domain-containing protein [Chloroflexi bacterium]|nr:GYD domain-containing protein [Chloroflexota bacterium]
MQLYMLQLAYTSEAWASMVSSPENRAEVWGRHLRSMGCRLVSEYLCFGEYDVVSIFEAPDDVTAAAAIIAIMPPGHIKATRTTKLLTVDEWLDATRKAGTAQYRGPGGTRQRGSER